MRLRLALSQTGAKIGRIGKDSANSLARTRYNYESCRKIKTMVSPSSSIPPITAFSFLSRRRLLALSGPDSTRYLQGAVTANVNPYASEGSYAVFLTAQGRILNDVFIYPFNEVEGRYKGERGWLIEVDAEEVESLAQRIKRYRLSSQFEIRVLPRSERGVWSVWDDTAKSSQMNRLLTSNINTFHSKGIISCTDGRAPGMGYRLLMPGDMRPDFNMEECHEDNYRVRRYLRGIPEGQFEILKENSLPQESNIDYMGGIDYQKGCYVGQELTIRTHHTGVVRKRILPLQIYSVEEEEPSDLIFNFDSRLRAEKIPINSSIYPWQISSKTTGKWLVGMGNIGLGLCRLANMTEVKVQGEYGNYKVRDEFKIDWDNDEDKKIAKVKAFIPPWHPQTIKN